VRDFFDDRESPAETQVGIAPGSQTGRVALDDEHMIELAGGEAVARDSRRKPPSILGV
jgi:hypothetical protein